MTMRGLAGFLVFLVMVALISCGGDSLIPELFRTGTLIIDAQPDGLEPGWTLRDNTRFSMQGSGDAFLEAMEPGEYSLAWDEVPGHDRPEALAGTLAAGDTLRFSGSYIGHGDIIVDPYPDELNAPWLLSGPEGYELESFGDTLITDLLSGNYEITWGAEMSWVADYRIPHPMSDSLRGGRTLDFSARYFETTNLSIRIYPEGLQASYTIHGPQGYEFTGTGDGAFFSLIPGYYDIVWGDMEGFRTPDDTSVGLDEGDTETGEGVYVPPSSLTIRPLPAGLEAPWTLTETGGYNLSGTGFRSLEGLDPGDYTIDWGDVAGYRTPEDTEGSFDGAEELVLEGEYDEPGWLVTIPAGEFVMGSPAEELGRDGDEGPQRSVELTHPFEIYSVEMGVSTFIFFLEYAYDLGYVTMVGDEIHDAINSDRLIMDLGAPGCEIMHQGGGDFTSSDYWHPVTGLTWYGAACCCDWMSAHFHHPRAYNHDNWECNDGDPYGAEGFRLPTEAEWEHACRAGSATAFTNGPITNTECDDPILDEIGWYCGNSGGVVKSINSSSPNAWGMKNIHGNVYEYCNDWYLNSYYGSGPDVDPPGPVGGSHRVVRGGAYDYEARTCRSANRATHQPGGSSPRVGFRPVRTVH